MKVIKVRVEPLTREAFRPFRAFHSDGSVGICIGVRVWHTVPISLEGEEVFQSVRGDQGYLAHSVEIDFDIEHRITFEPDC